MSQHDYILDNATGAAFRTDLNNALAAIATANSGAAEPTTTYPNQVWYDTTAGYLKIRNAANSAWVSFMPLLSATSQASTSGGSIDFTNIPSGTKRITVMLSEVSTNGSSTMLVRLGDSTGYLTGGYRSSANDITALNISSTGFLASAQHTSPASISGSLIITNLSGNLWVYQGITHIYLGQTSFMAGRVSLSGTLDRIRLTTTNGTDSFDAGTVNILYE